MAEKYELDRWAAVVCNGFTAVNVMSSGNVEELGWDYTEMELGSPGRWPAAPTRGIIDAVGKAPSVSEGAFLRLLGTVSVFMRRARRFPAGPAFPWVSLMAEGFLVPGKKTLKGVIG